jgi:hypothetical protein
MPSSTSREKQEKTNYWAIGIITSALLLAIFLLLQEINSKILALDIKWIVVASIPLIIALLKSNIIQKFKGFGIELETRLQEPIGKINLTAVDALSDLPGDEKQSMEYLHKMSSTRRLQIQRLTLKEGRVGYYKAEAVREYIHSLPNLMYIEVVSSEGKFIALIPIELFRYQEDIDNLRIGQLIGALSEKETKEVFGPLLITDTISEKENLIEALTIVRRSIYKLLPVLSGNGYLLGIITVGMIESRIADEVIAAQDKD